MKYADFITRVALMFIYKPNLSVITLCRTYNKPMPEAYIK